MPSSGSALPAALSRSYESSSSCCFRCSASTNGWYGLDFAAFARAGMVETVISLLVVRNVAHQRARAVDLFHQHRSGELMRQRHGREGEELVGTPANGVVEADVAAHHERDAVRLVDGESFQPLSKLQRIKRLASLVEDHRVPLLRNRRQQRGRIAGADDSGILRILSTFPGGDVDDLDREEVLDPVEVTVDHRAELGVGMGTRPEEA